MNYVVPNKMLRVSVEIHKYGTLVHTRSTYTFFDKQKKKDYRVVKWYVKMFKMCKWHSNIKRLITAALKPSLDVAAN